MSFTRRFLPLLLLALLCACAPSARAVTVTVSKTADTDDGTCDSDCSLREAINNAPVGGNVTFQSGLSGTVALKLGALQILKNLTIEGPATTSIIVSSSSGTGHTIYADGGTVTRLSNLTVSNSAHYFGIVNKGTMTLQNCTFTNASYNLVNVGGTLFVNNSTLFGNYIGVYNEGGTSTLRNCTVSRNGFGLYNSRAYGGLFNGFSLKNSG